MLHDTFYEAKLMKFEFGTKRLFFLIEEILLKRMCQKTIFSYLMNNIISSETREWLNLKPKTQELCD